MVLSRGIDRSCKALHTEQRKAMKGYNGKLPSGSVVASTLQV